MYAKQETGVLTLVQTFDASGWRCEACIREGRRPIAGPLRENVPLAEVRFSEVSALMLILSSWCENLVAT